MRNPVRSRPHTTVFAAAVVLAVLPLTAPRALRAQERSDFDGDLGPARTAPEAGGVVDLPRLGSSPVLDGVLDEAAWSAAAPLPLTMYQPVFRGESDRRIEVRVGYDDEAIWVSARFHHDDPGEIRAYSLTRDRWSGDDSFGIFLDTFNDEENAVRFVGMPLGNRMDMSVSGGGVAERGAGGPSGVSWNAFWDFETSIDESGWTGEMRIPFSSLQFESGPDGSVVMGMMVYAYEPAADLRWTFPAIPRTAQYTQMSAWQDVRLADVEPANPVYVTPYALTGSTRSAVLPEGPDPEWGTSTDRQTEFGLDLKMNPTSNLTLDLTVNTDFAAVEADQQQVNLTRFSLFFDEKRPFFQERAGIFEFATGADRGTLFYSRRIGLADGEPVPILGGARLVGRVGRWDIGLIEMQTDAVGDSPGENFGVARVRRRLLNDWSFAGGMLTSRVGNEGAYNVTWGLDALLRLFGDEYLTVKMLHTAQGGSTESDAAPDGLDAARVMVDWTRRRIEGFSYQNSFVWSGAGYDPGMGFESRTDFKRAQSDWSWQVYPGEGSTWRRVWVGVESNAWFRNRDDVMESGVATPFLQLETADGTTFRAEVSAKREDVETAFDLSDAAIVPVGTYGTVEGELQFRAPRGWLVRPNLTMVGGSFFDGRRTQVSGSVAWSAGRHVELTGGWEFNRVRFEDRDQAFDANLVRLTARFAANTKASLDVFGQYNSLNDQLTTNARFRYNFREGQDLWLVWNEGLNLERDVLGVPRLPRSDARTLTLKYTHTLIF